MSSSPTDRSRDFGALLRHWRRNRRTSQLDLSLTADISTRHLSCLETGRAQPSRDMVLRLTEALDVPLRERNTMLQAAGYAAFYRQTGLDAPELAAARDAIELLMAQLEPNPVLVLDRHWNTVQMNAGARRLLSLFPGCASGSPHNGVRLVFQPDGLRPFIDNWDVIAAAIIRRVYRDSVANAADEVLRGFLDELLSYPDVPSRWRMLDLETAPSAFLTINYRWQDTTFRLFSTLTTFGTALDVGLHELRVETFFAADDATRIALSRLA